MHTAIPAAVMGDRPNVFRRAEAWLDDRGRPAWIAAMVLGFVFFWPVGLALLAYMIVARKFKRTSHEDRTMFCRHRHAARHSFHAFRSSGNSAFDTYKTEMLKRLEDEQEAFESFLQRLREAKDKQEFDRFMDERATKASDSVTEAQA